MGRCMRCGGELPPENGHERKLWLSGVGKVLLLGTRRAELYHEQCLIQAIVDQVRSREHQQQSAERDRAGVRAT